MTWATVCYMNPGPVEVMETHRCYHEMPCRSKELTYDYVFASSFHGWSQSIKFEGSRKVHVGTWKEGIKTCIAERAFLLNTRSDRTVVGYVVHFTQLGCRSMLMLATGCETVFDQREAAVQT